MKRLLLDTQALLWWLADDPRPGPHARRLIQDERNEVFVSAASAWEIGIKKAMGKLKAPDDLDGIVEEEGFDKLPVSFFHGERAGELPPLCRDPFGRTLVAQAQAEGLDLVTGDAMLGRYGVKIVGATV